MCGNIFLGISLDGFGRQDVAIFIVFSGVVKWRGVDRRERTRRVASGLLVFFSYREAQHHGGPRAGRMMVSVFWSRPFPQIGQRRISWPVRRSILSGRDSFWGVGGAGAGSAERMSASVFSLEAEDSHP